MASLASKITPSVLISIGGLDNTAARHNTAIICSNLAGLLEKFQINTPLRLAHFLSQIAHESDSFNTLTEYASGAAYEGRHDLGNTHPGDGRRYKGRGPIQCTGRVNYHAFTKWVREHFDPNAPDFEAQPELLTEAPWAALSAIWYWSTHNINALADRDELVAVTEKINGGRNGLSDRGLKLGRAKQVIAQFTGDDIAYAQGGALEVLHRSSKGDGVIRLQRDLAKLGYHHGAIDGDFGAATEASVMAFQKWNELKADGIVGKVTQSAIQTALGGSAA
jgi:putative chitinase